MEFLAGSSILQGWPKSKVKERKVTVNPEPVNAYPNRSVLINQHRASFENNSALNESLRRISRFLQRPWEILKGVAYVVDLLYSVFA